MPTLRKFNTKAMKINSQQVKEMYERLRSGEINQREASRIYSLGVIQVGRIARGESRAQETGAYDNPVPNFNIQTRVEEIDASALRLRDKLDGSEPPAKSTTSWYDLPPPEVPGEPEGSGIEKLQELSRPSPAQQKVSDELDKLEKGD